MNENKKRVLLGSPVHQKPAILREFLISLRRLRQDHVDFGYFFIDDNQDEQSSAMLQEFAQVAAPVTVQKSEHRDEYYRNENTHFWNERLIWKVAEFKNTMIRHAIDEQYDFLFLVDSDLLLHPKTVEQLVASGKDIVSEIFWTSWQLNAAPQPQVWLRDEYTQWEQQRGEDLSDEEIAKRYEQFITQLKVPGVYEVGGLGACTLISRQAMVAGVNFNPIKNLSFWGEDRHFCIRASAMGVPLYVDTFFPAYHIYRESDLEGVENFKRESGGEIDQSNMRILPSDTYKSNGSVAKQGSAKLTLTMVLKNEGNRYLRQVLEEHRKYIDEAVIIDDGSEDNTVDICLDTLQGIPVRIVRNDISKFNNEVNLRKQQWEETIKAEPEWVLNLDADEIFESRFSGEVHAMLQQREVDVFCFRLYDFWNQSHYREDHLWRSHFTYRPFLIRYRPDFVYHWRETPQHCGRFPENIFELPHRLSDLRLKHFGWARSEYRLEKYQRYMLLDPEAKYGWMEQYLSILDQNPNLIPWIE
ncbi:glycosyltransferase [Paenibacillus sp. S28]|uniref:glycosyltransferase n=1 Tax=Paenibacillus sp. S28 TaxID=2767463 RepID=UPI001909897C|nr:glycosyltransferase [Paenibacillus sp. S28]MBJ9993539.1 glycosyltransferase family 2 protein [Paenibacillus sp. S28]